ncbi:hypothetical protein [Pseudokordiimonas caeni]|uniref:hypothetical protein n=1 Tax=Pseudokordiimonas caeni TaxID=2997908 RepID=UPI002810E0EB|nr:hypothetical protein [Pseudokordiimonas caeni]
MTSPFYVDIPPPSPTIFVNGICHPNLWLWDSWTAHDQSSLHLYCLALNRQACDGSAILPGDRNNYPFHIRHFLSEDDGISWRDLGVVAKPGGAADGADGRNVWSGSVLRSHSGAWLYGYTGLRVKTDERQFLQTICIADGTTPNAISGWSREALSCPLRDYDSILAAGYYLGAKDKLGSNAGEAGGPILAWRDPFLFYDKSGILNAVWAAKLGPTKPAVARATIRETEDGFVIDRLFPPIALPDAADFTQAEVPKIYLDAASGLYLMLISACDRLYEGQPNAEVTMEMRLYKSHDLEGPWQPYGGEGSRLPELRDLFGASIISRGFSPEELVFLGPYTENAGPLKQLSFAPPVRMKQTA